MPLQDCGPAKCQGLRGANGTQQTTLASEGSLLGGRSLCCSLGPGFREDKYPFPGPFCPLSPTGASLPASLPWNPSTHTHTRQAAKCPFYCALDQPRPLSEPLIYKLFVHLTRHSCSTPEDVIVPTPHFIRQVNQAQCLRGDLPGAPLSDCRGSWCAGARAAGLW